MGRLIIEIPPISDADSYYLQERTKPSFNYPLHKHDVYELNFVEHCKGARRVVGDSMEVLSDYDLALVGCGIEHAWEQYECPVSSETPIHEITIQWPKDLMDSAINRRVMLPLKEMLDHSTMGVAFGMKAIMTVYERLIALARSEPSFNTVQSFISILYDLAVSRDYHVLASSGYANAGIKSDSRRVHKVQDYIEAHYAEEIRIETLAAMVGMAPNALSRFFKQRTNRSISSYINEVRISQASQLLLGSTMSVLEISFKCGFNTISNFNRIFKSLKSMSPTEFREIYKKNIYLV